MQKQTNQRLLANYHVKRTYLVLLVKRYVKITWHLNTHKSKESFGTSKRGILEQIIPEYHSGMIQIRSYQCYVPFGTTMWRFGYWKNTHTTRTRLNQNLRRKSTKHSHLNQFNVRMNLKSHVSLLDGWQHWNHFTIWQALMLPREKQINQVNLWDWLLSAMTWISLLRKHN